MDESYFGGKHKGQRGRGAKGKSIVFGLLERDGRVYTRVVEGVSADELMEVIRKKTRKGSVYFTDWSFAKHILYNLSRGFQISFSQCILKEVEYRFNHRRDNLFKLFMNIYFGYVSH